MDYNFKIYSKYMLKLIRNKFLYILTKINKNDESFNIYVGKWMSSFYYYSILLYIFWFLIIGLLEILFFPVSYDLPQYILIRVSMMKILVIMLLSALFNSIEIEYNIVKFIENMSLDILKKRKFIIKTFFYNSFFIWCCIFILFLPFIIIPIILLKYEFLKDIFIILFVVFTSSCITSYIRLLLRSINNSKKKINVITTKIMYSIIIVMIPFVARKFYYYYKLIKDNKIMIVDILYNFFGVEIENLIFHNKYTIIMCLFILLSIIISTRYLSSKVMNYQDERNTELKIINFNKTMSIFIDLYRRYGIVDEDLIVITTFFSALNLLVNYNGDNTLIVNSITLFMLMNLTFRKYNIDFILFLSKLNVNVFRIVLMNSVYIFCKVVILFIPYVVMGKFNKYFLLEFFVYNILLVYAINLIYFLVLKKIYLYFEGELLNKIVGYISISIVSLIVSSIFLIIK